MTAVLAIALGIAITAAMRFELSAASWRRKHDKLAVEIEALRCGDLVPFADGELSTERAAAFRDHLATCTACERELETQMQLSARMSEARRQ